MELDVQTPQYLAQIVLEVVMVVQDVPRAMEVAQQKWELLHVQVHVPPNVMATALLNRWVEAGVLFHMQIADVADHAYLRVDQLLTV